MSTIDAEAERPSAAERAERWIQREPTVATEERAQLALSVHALHVAKFAQGEEPPPIVEDEMMAKLIVAGVQGTRGILEAQRELIAEYERWSNAMRPRIAAGLALLHGAPAVEAWRKAAIADRRRPLLERLAAWEITAIMCDADGNTELAERARQTARELAVRRTPTNGAPERHARTA